MQCLRHTEYVKRFGRKSGRCSMTALISSAFSQALGLLPFDTACSRLVNPRMPSLKVALLITCRACGCGNHLGVHGCQLCVRVVTASRTHLLHISRPGVGMVQLRLQCVCTRHMHAIGYVPKDACTEYTGEQQRHCSRMTRSAHLS